MSTNKKECGIDINVDAPLPEVTDFASLEHGDMFTIKGEHGNNIPVYMKTREVSGIDGNREFLVNAVGLLTGNLMRFRPESKVYKLN